MGVLLARMGELDRAEESFERAKALAPSYKVKSSESILFSSPSLLLSFSSRLLSPADENLQHVKHNLMLLDFAKEKAEVSIVIILLPSFSRPASLLPSPPLDPALFFCSSFFLLLPACQELVRDIRAKLQALSLAFRSQQVLRQPVSSWSDKHASCRSSWQGTGGRETVLGRTLTASARSWRRRGVFS